MKTNEFCAVDTSSVPTTTGNFSDDSSSRRDTREPVMTKPGSPTSSDQNAASNEGCARSESASSSNTPRSLLDDTKRADPPSPASQLRRRGPAAKPKKVFARLSKSSPYIGYFHYAPSAGNRSRRTYFEASIISTEAIQRQHAVRSNPMIGNFHYGHDLYGKRFQDFQRILAQLKAKDVERETAALMGMRNLPFTAGHSPPGTGVLSARFRRGRARSSASLADTTDKRRLHRSNSTGKAGVLTQQHAEQEGIIDPAEGPREGYPKNLVGVNGRGEEPLLDSNSVDDKESSSSAGDIKSISSEGDRGENPRGLAGAYSGTSESERSDDEEDPDVSESTSRYQERERRKLRKNAYAIVVYASGDSLVKLVEKERRIGGATNRFKYAGAIDTSKCYPKSGSLDDCALLRPVVAERSKLYNDLIAEVNGFRRHFFLRQKMHPKEAYRQARRKYDATMTLNDIDDIPRLRHKSDSYITDNSSWSAAGSYSSDAGGGGGFLSGPNAGVNGGDRVGSTYGGGTIYDPSSGTRVVTGDDGIPPFHTLVGPVRSVRHRHVWGDAAEPGDTWMPGTVSALKTKESWRSKQEMRDFRKFKPFFVQAKTDFTSTYRLLNDCVLGEGSYASVFLAVHIKREEEVAVKAVQKRLLFSDEEKKSVGREIDNQLRIVHKHIVRLYEVYETPDNVFIVLENCPSGDLEKMMYLRGHLTEIEAKRVTMQLLEGINYIHSKGIVHCDIKPQNLLFAPDPDDADAMANAKEKADSVGVGSSADGDHKRVKQQGTSPAGQLAKLCDFGISCKVPNVRFYKQTGDINKIPWSGLFGTGGYIAPEIMEQEPFGKPADLWSVGVMLYQMLAGRLPFTPPRMCVSKPVSFPGHVWNNVSVAAKDIICGLLDPSPSTRLTAAQALEHPWIQTIQHLRPSFPHFVPKQGRAGNGTKAGAAS